MHLDRPKNTVQGKTYTRILLRDSYRDANGQVKHHTLANLSHCSEEEIRAIELALQHKHHLADLQTQLDDPLHLRQGLSYGAIYLLHRVAERLGLVDALGQDRPGQLALWQVYARALNQGSRLGAVRLAQSHAVGEVLDLEPFNEDHLYANLGWLTGQQTAIEQSLFQHLYADRGPHLYLYDVTSSYLEGACNALAAWGYNRDGKKGKPQIVIGLLCDQTGNALSIEVFPGNTNDTKTFGQQILKVAERFGGKAVTLVGDRGMIKGPQMKELNQTQFHYITAITKPQIEKLLQKKVMQMELFEERLAEVEDPGQKVRYVLRRNPVRAQEMAQTRAGQLAAIEKLVAQKNQYLAAHKRAQVTVASGAVSRRIQSFKASAWLKVEVNQRQLQLVKDEAELKEVQKLDGCYVLKTDLTAAEAPMQIVHDRYKDLAQVEQNFRTMKTAELEMRPVYVQLEANTRGHALVVMLAYRLIKELEKCWSGEDLTVEEGLKQLDSYCVMEVMVNGQVKDTILPEPRDSVRRLLELAKVELPKKVKSRKVAVATKQKLQKYRPRRSK